MREGKNPIGTMPQHHPIIVFLPLLLFSFSTITSAATQSPRLCHNRCGDEQVPFPFGFSDGCPIRLQCSENGSFPILHGYKLKPRSISSSGTLKIHLDKDCNRTARALSDLYGVNFAPTSRNAVLFHDCASNHPCKLPFIDVETRFDVRQCPGNSTISCYGNKTSDGFFAYNRSSHCKYLLSSIWYNNSASGLLLDVEIMELEWWLPGNDCRCSRDANCTVRVTPRGEGFRCNCNSGMIGDGYLAGEGCREVTECNFRKYVAGRCGGPKRAVIFVGGSVVCVILMIMAATVCIMWRSSNAKVNAHTRKKVEEASGFMLPVYSYKVIERATNGFSNKNRLGIGGYGTVYLGKLYGDSTVAIKKIKNRDPDTIELFINEIGLISSVSHPNLVRLLGCCIENGEQILVYEFMPNGTLSHHLHRERGNGLPWAVRLEIASETAHAISHLHSAVDPPIYHRDIKTSNILLDHNFRPKLADFGLSRHGLTEMSHISTAPQGTIGYLDPQYHQNFHLSDRSDVYSFGVVLVEIITAMKAVDFSRSSDEINLAALATDRIGKGKLVEIVDPFIDLQGDSWTLFSVHRVAELAFRCLAYNRETRPSMTEVAEELDQIKCSRFECSETNCSAASYERSTSSSSHVNDDGLFVSMKTMAELEDTRLPAVASEMSGTSSSSSFDRMSPMNSPSTSSLLHNIVR